jgi:ribosomal protein S14
MKKNRHNKKKRTSFKRNETKQLLLSILMITNNPLSKFITTSRKNQKKNSLVRIKNHCVLTLRSCGICSNFKISRIKLRELALDGLVNGIKKASW